MSYESLLKELKPEELSLDQIYLDPNNPRFTGSDWQYRSESEVKNSEIQEHTRSRLVKEFGVNKLRMNMEVNGYLPIDRVVVRALDHESYVVLEGNRRICAAKMIAESSANSSGITSEVAASVEQIPCLIYTGDSEDAAWILQGLRHITGVVEWSSYHKAKLLAEQMENEAVSLTEVGRRFGLTAHGAGQWTRGYYAFRQAKQDSDYIEEVDEKLYPYLQELFSRSSIKVREWMEWNDREYRFDHELNFNEFLSWFYPRPDDEEGLDQESEALGEWEKRKIRRQDDIRQVAYLLSEDVSSFEQFRREKDIEAAYAAATIKKQQEKVKKSFDPSDEVMEAIADCTKALQDAPFRMLKDEEIRGKLLYAVEKLEQAIRAIRELGAVVE